MTTFAEFLTKENINIERLTPHNIELRKDYIKFVMYSYVINEAVHGFVVVKVFGESGRSLLYEYEDKNGRVEGDYEVNRSDVYLHGSVKWDGCSNWHFDAQDGCMLHFCSVDEAALTGELMKTAYHITSEEMEGFEG